MQGQHGLLPKDTSWEKYTLSLSLTREGLGKPRKDRGEN